MEPGFSFEPTLKVSTRELGDVVEIRVRDNGIGIPPEIKDRLFQPFFTAKPPGEGTGLGLSISYDIITQQHGGSISLDSKVGEYSEFAVRLRFHFVVGEAMRGWPAAVHRHLWPNTFAEKLEARGGAGADSANPSPAATAVAVQQAEDDAGRS
jgi:hypothetical protein